MDLIKVRVYFKDLETGRTKGFDDNFRDYAALKRYLKDRLKWTTFRTLVLIKGNQIESQDQET